MIQDGRRLTFNLLMQTQARKMTSGVAIVRSFLFTHGCACDYDAFESIQENTSLVLILKEAQNCSTYGGKEEKEGGGGAQ